MACGSAPPSPAWTCTACGHVTLAGLTCDLCGVARRAADDPPLDIPHQPGLTSLPAFWLAIVWGAVAAAGALLWLWPTARATLGDLFLLGQVAGAGGAAGSSLFTARWQRRFNALELAVPAHARAGDDLLVEVRLTPYRTLENVSVKLRLVDRFYRRTGDGDELARRQLGSAELLVKGRLRGRRVTSLSHAFVAPFPDTPHESIRADLLAGLVGLLAFAVPALAWQARNMREHGGYYVEAEVRVGRLRRRYHRRVITYFVGADLHVG